MENNGNGVKGWGFMVGVRGLGFCGLWFLDCQLGVGVCVCVRVGGWGFRGSGYGVWIYRFSFSCSVEKGLLTSEFS